jgi:hypothetical protein
MKTLLCTLTLMGLAMAAPPAWAQNAPSTTLQNPLDKGVAPGTGGVSKPGIAGKPGGKSGPTVSPSGSSTEPNSHRSSGDESGVQGMPGNKSGPSVRPPSNK